MLKIQYSSGEIGRLWSDDGSSGGGYIHAPPARPFFVVDTFAGLGVSYRPLTHDPLTWLPACLLFRFKSKELEGTPEGTLKEGIPAWNPLSHLIGSTLTLTQLYDAMAALDLGAVVTTHSGGSYLRVR